MIKCFVAIRAFYDEGRANKNKWSAHTAGRLVGPYKIYDTYLALLSSESGLISATEKLVATKIGHKVREFFPRRDWILVCLPRQLSLGLVICGGTGNNLCRV